MGSEWIEEPDEDPEGDEKYVEQLRELVECGDLGIDAALESCTSERQHRLLSEWYADWSMRALRSRERDED